jgi:hypothetical protein
MEAAKRIERSIYVVDTTIPNLGGVRCHQLDIWSRKLPSTAGV